MKTIQFKRLRLFLCVLLAVVTAATALILPTAAAGNRASPASPSANGRQPESVYLGGMPFGVKFYTDGVMVVGFCDVEGDGGASNPARDAGMKLRDVIVAVNNQKLGSAAELTAAVEHSAGSPLTLTVRRPVSGSAARDKRANPDATTEVTVTGTPEFCLPETGDRTGVWVRDSGAGIGMVTFIIPHTQAFAGLGHGICDGDTGELIPMQRGQVTDVTVSGIEKGIAGDPGAIKGYFNPGKTGTLVGNTACGVFGILSSLPASADCLVPVAARSEVKEGSALIRCTLDDGRIGEYAVNISSIDASASGSKCFTLTVTDPVLLEKTGGIVQGMSGSPILQNGKLVGAVTHVLINDPTVGYGIFLDNMLRDMPELLR